jgi:ATP-dependent Lon protease
MASGEYDRVKLGAWIRNTASMVVPKLPDTERVQTIHLPDKPVIGEVIGLAVAGDYGYILHFEMQVNRGDGRIIPLDSIQRVMRESIEATTQYIRAHSTNLGLNPNWYE